jgi:hypothetical protein
MSTTLSGKTFYVATNGSDLNNGTSLATPFATWQRGINVAYPGDTIFIRGGVYYVTGYDNFPEINPAAYPTPKGRCGTVSKKYIFGHTHRIILQETGQFLIARMPVQSTIPTLVDFIEFGCILAYKRHNRQEFVSAGRA